MTTQETAGKIYYDLKNKVQDKATVWDVVFTTQQDYMPELCALVEKEKVKTDKDLFVEVAIVHRKLFPDAPGRKMIPRHTCPTPWYDISVYHYDKKKEALFFLWHIPSYQECQYYIANPNLLTKEEQQSLKMALDFKNGTFIRLAKKLNGEVNDYNLIFYRKDENGK